MIIDVLGHGKWERKGGGKGRGEHVRPAQSHFQLSFHSCHHLE